MKATNGVNTVETNDFLKNIWIRDGYWIVDESEPVVYSKEAVCENEFTYSELKSLAKKKGINSYGMKKEDILKALGM